MVVLTLPSMLAKVKRLLACSSTVHIGSLAIVPLILSSIHISTHRLLNTCLEPSPMLMHDLSSPIFSSGIIIIVCIVPTGACSYISISYSSRSLP